MGRKTLRYSQIRSTNYDLRRNRHLGITCRCVLKYFTMKYSAGWKTPRHTQIRATNYDFRGNRHLGINVSMCIKVVPKEVLSGSKNSQLQSKPSYKLWLATKSSPGQQRVEVHWGSPRMHAQRVEKLPHTPKFGRKLSFEHQRVSLHRNSSQKRAQRVEEPPRYTEI